MKYKLWDHIVYRKKFWIVDIWEFNWVITGCCHWHYHIKWTWLTIFDSEIIWLYEEKKEKHYLTMEDIAEKFGIKYVDSIKIVKVLDCNK